MARERARACWQPTPCEPYVCVCVRAQPLIEHLASHYSHRFADIDYVDTFKMLKIKYDQQQVSVHAKACAAKSPEGYFPRGLCYFDVFCC